MYTKIRSFFSKQQPWFLHSNCQETLAKKLRKGLITASQFELETQILLSSFWIEWMACSGKKQGILWMALGEFRGEEVAKYGWNWGFYFEKSELQNTSRGHFAVDIDLLKPWIWLQKSHLHQGLDWKGLLARRVEMKMKIRPGLKKYTRFHWLFFFHSSYPFIQKKWAKDVCLKGVSVKLIRNIFVHLKASFNCWRQRHSRHVFERQTFWTWVMRLGIGWKVLIPKVVSIHDFHKCLIDVPCPYL